MPADLDSATYVSFVSRRRDGTPVAVPVWIAPFEDGYTFTTDSDSWKVKRVRHEPSVTLQVCGMRGRVRPGAVVHSGSAEILDDDRYMEARAAIRAKYPIAYRVLIGPGEWWAARRGRPPGAGSCAIKVTLTA